ncbi:CRISPR repeat RNA endoribonuclease Cas6 [hydrothermal vent metagenome]|uniref:CRISPR repeat RNA endoribonuclease Cas6 n=1 Tax=hydrothermal vent metagenome TaxID=652676 RepID=A0A1W1D2I6_9ZZZZ
MRYTNISILIKTPTPPPYFIGSQIRGAFGYALKKVSCINPSYKCEGCFAKDNCVYYDFYEKKNTFHPYRFDITLGLKYYDFSLFLFENTTTQLPYVVSALHLMLTKNGLGKERKTYNDFSLFINDEECFQNGKIHLPNQYVKTFQINSFAKDITLVFQTPLRIKKANQFIRDTNIELAQIINSIHQRKMKLLQKEYQKFPHKIQGNITAKELTYKELTRMSNRQKTTMKLGGLMGKIEIKNLNKECYETLKLGELIGVGKQTVFGLGKIGVIDE